MANRIWITWEIQRRNRTTSNELHATLFELVFKGWGWLKYPWAIARTLQVLWAQKARVVFVQNPSIVLATMSVCYGRLTGVPVVVDAHNAGVHPFEGRRPWASVLAKAIMRMAALTLVTNDGLAEYVIAQGGRPFVLPDPIPRLKRPSSIAKLGGTCSIMFICTWAEDEPYLEVLRAAAQIDNRIRIYITGNSKGREQELGAPIPGNVVLTGYLDEPAYLKLLFSADVIMDLTTREDCLVCGAYEAVAAEKSLILSNAKAIRRYFHKGAIYTDNSRGDIAKRIAEAIENRDQLATEVHALKAELIANWAKRLVEFETELERLAPSAP